MTSTVAYLEQLFLETNKPETEIIALAMQTGLRQLWRGRVLGQYLQDEISRDDAVNSVGIDWVELAARQRDAMLEDVAWALQM
jgi:hypothetical protein